MCITAFTPSHEAALEVLFNEDIQQELLQHVGNCLPCLFAMTKQREPLAVSGCPKFQALFYEAYPLFESSESPLGTIHLSEEMIENYHFKRMSPVERKIFEMHTKLCSECAVQVHNELMLIYAMKAALTSNPSLYRNRNGAAFEAVA